MRLEPSRPRSLAIALVAASLLSLASSAAARADALPEGTELMTLHAGEVKPLEARDGSQIVCDDPSVVHGEIVSEKFVLVAGHEGQTMCAVRFDGQSRAIYLVTVRAAEKAKK